MQRSAVADGSAGGRAAPSYAARLADREARFMLVE
jgi:hypothetical protein